MVQALHGPFSVELSHCKKVLDHHYFPDLLFHHFFGWGSASLSELTAPQTYRRYIFIGQVVASAMPSTLQSYKLCKCNGFDVLQSRMHKVYQNVHMASCILHVLSGASDQQKGHGLEICLRPVSWKVSKSVKLLKLLRRLAPLVFCWRSPRVSSCLTS